MLSPHHGQVKPGDPITIGKDLPSYVNLVLDPMTLSVVPVGVRGVLFVGGVGVGPPLSPKESINWEGLGTRLDNVARRQ